MSNFFVYILKSNKDGKHYYGSTSDLKKRVLRHNAGRVTSTKNRIPFVLIYHEELETLSEARRRELFFKSIDGYNWLKDQKII